MNAYTFGALFSALVVLSGCATTQLQAPADSAVYQRLSRANARPVSLSLQTSLKSSSLGAQFLLVMIPFGSIELGDPAGYFHRHAARALAFCGYSPVSAPDSPKISVEIKDASLSAYDFLFVRRISGSLSARAVLHDSRGNIQRISEVSHDGESYQQFAFEPELSALYGRVVEETFSALFGELLGVVS